MNNFSITIIMAVMFSFFVAFILTTIPVPEGIHWLRPDWVTLTLIYWVLAYPRTIGIFTGFFIGLIMDIQANMLLGQYALVMSVVAYCTDLLHTRLRLFLFWQQALIVLLLVGFSRLVLLWEQWIIGHPPTTLLYWSSTVTSLIFWPIVYGTLQWYQQYFAKQKELN